MASDLRKTLAQFVKAKAASTLPVEELVTFMEASSTRKQQRLRHKAKRVNLSHRAIGQLYFSSSMGDSPKPLPYVGVELWDRDIGSSDDYLGESVTDSEGRFEILYDPDDAGSFDTPDLDLRIIDSYRGKKQVLFVIRGREDVTLKTFDFGRQGVPFYEYHPDIPLPHILTFNYGKAKFDAMPQSYPLGRKLALAEVASAVLGIRLRHYLGGDMTIDEIQADYQGKTSYRPPSGPGPDAGFDELFLYKVLNSAGPCRFTRGSDERLHVIYNWDAYEMDGVHYLPNVDAVFEYQDRVLRACSITIQERRDSATAAHAPLADAVTTRPDDDAWQRVCHEFLCNNYLYTQITNHLARGHFNVEQWALGAYRNLHKNPVRDLLFHHLQGVMIINVEGESAIFGPDGLITKNSALTENSLVQAIMDRADIDWYEFSPRQAMTDSHHFAMAANLYWSILGEYVDDFFAHNLPLILRYWSEVQDFCDDVVAHSVPYQPYPLPDGHRHFDTNEVIDEHGPRRQVGEALRTVSVFAPAGEATEEHVAHLMQVCRFVIYHATFFHSWINDTSDALEASYTQYNPVHHSTSKELTDHISLNLALSQTKYGLIVANEEGDVPSDLIDRLVAKADEFARFGFDVRAIRSHINI